MPLQDQKSTSAYVQTTKVYVSSSDRAENSRGQYDYTFEIPQQIQYVIGFEVTAHQFPTDLAPTFVPAVGSSPGTNKVDFSISCSDPEITRTFSFTWPPKYYTYDWSTANSASSYMAELAHFMREAVASDPVFGTTGSNSVTLYGENFGDSYERTYLLAYGLNITSVGFLFLTGPNARNSAFYGMGFTRDDTIFKALVYDEEGEGGRVPTPGDFTITEIASPNKVQLSPFRYFDINIAEAAEFKPLKRIYINDGFSNGSVRTEADITRTRLLSSQPLRNLVRLNVRITLENGAIPPSGRIEHAFTLNVFHLVNEITSLPGWMKQVFVL